MDSTVIVGLLSLGGTCIGSLAGIIASNKLINYRLDKLEKKVDKHNNVIERTYELEGKMREVEHNIRDLKGELK